MIDIALAIILPLGGLVVIYRYFFENKSYNTNKVAVEG